jgi:signal transduction histidine kinase/streptogramin lyase
MGSFRFDGVRFLPWPSPAASSNDVRNFLPAKNGGFWIRDRRSVTHVTGRRVTAHFDFQGAYFSDHGNDMFEDVDGSLWVVMARYEGAGTPLCKVTDLAAHCFGGAEGMPVQRADSILPDGQGGFWIGNDTALIHWNSGHSSVYGYKALRSNGGRDGIVSLAPSSDGSLWVGIAKSGPGLGLEKFVGGDFTPFLTSNFDGTKIAVSALLRDSNQNLWVGTDTDGIYRIHGETAEHFGIAEGLSSDTVSGLYEDREGVIWVTTSSGLDSFRDRNVTTFSQSEGLRADLVESVMASRDGTVWVGNVGSLDFIRNGQVFSIRSSDGLPGDRVTSLLEDRAGRIWVGVDDGLFLYEHHHFRRLPEPHHRPLGAVLSITEDVDGNIWAETLATIRQLVRIRNFQVQEVFSSSQVPGAHSLAADPQGGLWVSTVTGDLVRFHNGAVQTFQLKIKGDLPRQIEAESDGSILLAAPADGLVGLRRGRFQRLAMKNGLPCDGVLGFVQDDDKQWWLEAPCGYILVADSEMQRWWGYPDTIVQYHLFDTLDGARTNLVSYNPATKSPDGRLWFATHVVQTIDPRHLFFNKLPPPVHIEQIIADHHAHEATADSDANVDLPPQVHDLEIDYTALSLPVPDKVLFRYKLEGRDRDWQDAGKRRQAFYTDLSPGRYRFRVTARNNSGLWNDAGTFVDFSIAPAYYQTTWFRVLCVVTFLGLLCVLYRFRLRQLHQQFNIGLEARVNERTRIARDLHDTLLQSFQGLMLHFQAASNLLPMLPGEAKKKLDDTITFGNEAIAEGRGAIQGLRSSAIVTNDLARSISTLGEELAAAQNTPNAIVFQVAVEGTPQNLHPILRDDVYRIAGEALRNAFKHAQAKHIEVEIRYDKTEFRLRVRDDGAGIDPRILSEDERPGHYGLRGMRERAKLLGGKLSIWSELDSGTELELQIPARNAYERLPDRQRSWFAKTFSGRDAETQP